MGVNEGDLQVGIDVDAILEKYYHVVGCKYHYIVFKEKSERACLHIKNRSDLYPIPSLLKAKKQISVVTS